MNEIRHISDLNEAASILFHDQQELKDICGETGEFTPEADTLEARIEAMTYVVEHDGTDMLGRRIKEAEDRIKMLKAERDHTSRMIKAELSAIDYYKFLISEVMRLTGKTKVKGTHYSFTAYVSEKTTLNEFELDRRWLDVVTKAARDAGLPGYIDVALKTTATRVKEWAQTHDGQGDIYLVTDTEDAVRFTKPRASKEDK